MMINSETIRKHYLWVYGTLKQGYYNDSYLAGADFLGDFEVNGVKLYKGKFAPFLKTDKVMNNDARCRRIRGELYLVSDKHLEKIDTLEGHPYLYERMQLCWIEPAPSVPHVCVQAYVYKLDVPETCPLIYEWTEKPTFEILHRQ